MRRLDCRFYRVTAVIFFVGFVVGFGFALVAVALVIVYQGVTKAHRDAVDLRDRFRKAQR